MRVSETSRSGQLLLDRLDSFNQGFWKGGGRVVLLLMGFGKIINWKGGVQKVGF